MNSSDAKAAQGSRVSVVIPTYNRAYCIDNAIQSVLSQTHSDVEVVIVDDGSTDGTRELIKVRYASDNRIKYIHRENGGVSAARNTGLRQATGDFIALLDSDDVWKPWKLELQLACLQLIPHAGMVWTDMEAVDPHGHVFDPRFLRTMYSAYQWFPAGTLFGEVMPLPAISVSLPSEAGKLYAGNIFSQMIMGNLVHTSTVLLRRDRLEKVKAFDEGLKYSGEDYDFHLRTCRAGPVAFADIASIQYAKGLTDQLTGSDYAIYRARNFLKTITPHIENDRANIDLPQDMIDYVLSEAHAYIGESALDLGNVDEARSHLFQALQLRPRQPRIAALLAISLLPFVVGRAVRRLYAGVKARTHPHRRDA